MRGLAGCRPGAWRHGRRASSTCRGMVPGRPGQSPGSPRSHQTPTRQPWIISYCPTPRKPRTQGTERHRRTTDAPPVAGRADVGAGLPFAPLVAVPCRDRGRLAGSRKPETARRSWPAAPPGRRWCADRGRWCATLCRVDAHGGQLLRLLGRFAADRGRSWPIWCRFRW